MEEGQNSGAQNIIDFLMTKEEISQITPATATEVDAPACLISWVSNVDDYNYKPDKVHIGPFHRHPFDHWTEKEKKKLLHRLLDRHIPQHQRKEELRRYQTAMEGLEDLARQCYNRSFSTISTEAFACMLLLDGYFLYSCFVASTAPVVPVLSTDITLVRDVVFLLENQIPFFILEQIHKLITPGAEDDDSAFVVVDNVARHVEMLVRLQRYVSKEVTFERRQRPCHLLHLLYMYFRPTALDAAEEVQLTVHDNPPVNGNATSGSGPQEDDMTYPLIPVRWRAASYYDVAGVRLVKRKLDGGEARSILDVEVTGGTLRVPCLMVDSNTLRMLQNMVALEQHNRRLGSHVSAYCLFMSQLANTEKDVALLVTKGIIVHFLRSDNDVATGLAELCDGIILDVYNPKLNYLMPKQEALVRVMEQEIDDSGEQNAIDSLITEIEEMQITPATATKVDASACLISWVDGDYNYKPDKVHIGPFYRDPHNRMEKKKKKLLRVLLDRQRPQHQRKEELRRYLTAMEGLEDLARQCYDNRSFSTISTEAFACMLLLDGCFLYSRFVATTAPDVPVASTDITVVRDVIFLLGNQIPFFVLKEIHKLITPGAGDDDSAFFVVDNVARHVETLVRRHGYVSKVVTLERRQRPDHLLHLLYMYFHPTVLHAAKEVQLTVHNNPPVNGNATSGSGPQEEDMTNPLIPARWRGASYYYVAGVRLVKRELDGCEARSILDVELTGGTLRVPCLMVDSNTLRMLHNMVALEQHNRRLGSHVSAYCLFMSQMANTEKDVALLVTKGIIVHFLRSDNDVATGLAELCDGIILDVYNPRQNYLRPKHEALENLCRDGWRKSMAWLRHSKCNNYLMVLSVVAAVIGFICTFEQSVFAAVSYAKGKTN